ncbi:MAG: Fic family protein [Campylobacterota bacterium]|nr:Fic family protein [Campylobacterota bacterium]
MDELTSYEQQALKHRLKIEWTYRSNAIEGNTISLGDTAFIIENGLTIKGKSIVEHNEIIGHARAIDLIYEMVERDNISKEDICLLHKAVQTEHIIDSECPIGSYKVQPNGRYVKMPDGNYEHYFYPHPNDTAHLMALWFKDFEDISKPFQSFEECVELYTDMHLAFASIHPFFDGNGRLARLVANIPLLKRGYLPLIVSNEDRQEYIELLSNYNLEAKALDKNSINLIEKNEQYQKLKEFFKDQYKNSERLLAEIVVRQR